MALSSLSAHQQEALVDALKRGSPDAFARIYEAYRGRIYNLAARMLGDREDAADVTQEVFLTAYRRLPGHRGRMRLEPWLYKVAVNACYDYLRRRSRRSADALPDADALAAPVDELERAELSAAICDALQQVTPRYRAALLLKEVHGCKNSEVADILGIGTGTTGVLLFRARKAFHKALKTSAHAGPVNISAVGVGALLPELPVPASLTVPPAALLPTPVCLGDTYTPALPAAPIAAPAGPLSPLGAVAPGTPLAAAATAGTVTKLGSAAVAKVLLAVVGMTALATGGVSVGSLATHPAPSGADAAHTQAAPLGQRGGTSYGGRVHDAAAGRSRLLRPGDRDAVERYARSGLGTPRRSAAGAAASADRTGHGGIGRRTSADDRGHSQYGSREGSSQHGGPTTVGQAPGGRDAAGTQHGDPSGGASGAADHVRAGPGGGASTTGGQARPGLGGDDTHPTANTSSAASSAQGPAQDGSPEPPNKSGGAATEAGESGS